MMTMQEGALPAPGASTRHAVEFNGSGGEYFRIWIVNLALTIITLGIFSAWAKVRNKRYFYGNTIIDGHSFDYHGAPLRILLGRLIALAIFVGYYVTVLTAPAAVFVWLLIFLVAAPWLIRSSFRFNARNASYRNIRFDFHGTYGGALKAFVLWPIAGVFSLFTLLPLAHRARDYYHINFHSFGGQFFHAKIPLGKLYLIYGIALAILVAGIALMGVAVARSGVGLAGLQQHNPQQAAALAGLIVILMVIYLGTILFLVSFIGTMTFNLAINGTGLGDRFRLESDLSPIAMAWITYSNIFLILITLGLFSPWAHIRLMRYIAGHFAVTGDRTADNFLAVAAAPGSAVGEEVAGFFDFDMSL